MGRFDDVDGSYRTRVQLRTLPYAEVLQSFIEREKQVPCPSTRGGYQCELPAGHGPTHANHLIRPLFRYHPPVIYRIWDDRYPTDLPTEPDCDWCGGPINHVQIRRLPTVHPVISENWTGPLCTKCWAVISAKATRERIDNDST